MEKRGFLFPLQMDKANLVGKEQRIRNRIRTLLSIRPGEQAMNRSFGCDLYSFLHQPLSQSLEPLITFQVEQALQRWIPEVRMLSCSIKEMAPKEGRVKLVICYSIIQEQTIDEVQISLSS